MFLLKGDAKYFDVLERTIYNGTKISSQEQPLTLIPFYARCNRGEGEMRIWLPKKIVNVDLLGY